MQLGHFREWQQARLIALASGAESASDTIGRIAIPSLNRLQALGAVSAEARNWADELIELALRGLPRMQRRGAFAHTMRAVQTRTGRSVRPEGDSLRCQAIVALGLARLDIQAQRRMLGGSTAADLACISATRAEICGDAGAIALAAWAAAEAADIHAAPLFRRLGALLATDAPIATIDCSWLVAAALAAAHLDDTSELAVRAAQRLVAAQGASGLFPHTVPAQRHARWRADVGCFADQVFPIQALARLHAAQGDPVALAAAEDCALRLCELQGPAGQWWWHYGVRDGAVVDPYPVYSVHQHAIGPMALLDLREAGGSAHWDPLVEGVKWLDRHPEVSDPLVCDVEAVVWRKVTGRDPVRLGRAVSAVTGRKPGLRLSWLDRILPPKRIDHQCRPYELGWLLYAWLSGGCVERLRGAAASRRA